MTVTELDQIVDLTLRDKQLLVYGSHLSGGGFGGSIVTLLHKDAVKDIKTTITVSKNRPSMILFNAQYCLHGNI